MHAHTNSTAKAHFSPLFVTSGISTGPQTLLWLMGYERGQSSPKQTSGVTDYNHRSASETPQIRAC